MSWPTDKVLPAVDLARALLVDRKVAGRKGQTAMGAYSMAYAGDGGPTPDKIAAAQAQDLVLRIVMSAGSDGRRDVSSFSNCSGDGSSNRNPGVEGSKSRGYLTIIFLEALHFRMNDSAWR